MVKYIYKWFLTPCLMFALSFTGDGLLYKAENSLHPFFVSVTEIQHNSKDRSLEISCKIFTDDFEKTLRQNYKTHIDLLNPKDKAAMDKLISGYIKGHLQIISDGALLNLQFVGYENDEEAVWCHFQVENMAM